MSFNKSGQNSFHAFSSKYRTVKSSAFTHTSMMSPIASFYIPGLDEEKFLKLYNDALERNEVLHMTEKHRDISPILIDLDFRYPNEIKGYFISCKESPLVYSSFVSWWLWKSIAR